MGLLQTTIGRTVPQDGAWRARAKRRLEQLTMPFWAMGRLMDLAEDLAGMTRTLSPLFSRRTVVVMAGDHGVVEEGVSQYPQAVTAQMVRNFVSGGAGINAMARVGGARLVVVDMGVAGDLADLTAGGKVVPRGLGAGTGNMTLGPAMAREVAVRSVEAGIGMAMDLGAETDLFGTGDMGIGNTTASAAIASVLTGRPVSEVTGRGTGIDTDRLSRKVDIIRKAIETNRPDPGDGVDVLAKVGGYEIGGIAGLVLGAASLGRPVVVDGFISSAGALIAQALCPASADYVIASHRSAEPGHDAVLERLGKRPLLDLALRLGEGTGAALAMPLVEAAARLLTDVRTFEEAMVSKQSG